MRRLADRWPISGAGAWHCRLWMGVFVAVAFLCSAGVAVASTLSGVVTDGTTKRPVAGAEVVVMQLEHGMEPLARTKTDAHGRFRFGSATTGKAPLLLQVSYAGVPYYQSVEHGSSSAAVVVYDVTADPKAVLVASRSIVLQPSGKTLQVEEQYAVENQTKPPMAFRPAGKPTFEFQLPDGAQGTQVATSTETGMPTLQKTIQLPNGRQAIDWVFRPGKSYIRISYLLPYSSSRAVINTASVYSLLHVFLAVPAGVQVSSDGFSRLGSEEGYDVYGRQSVKANTEMAISVSGTASDSTGATAASGSAKDAAVSTLPSRMHNFTWALALGLTVALFFFTMLVWRRSAARPKTASATGPESERSASGIADEHSQFLTTSVTRAVQDDIGKIRDELFDLELRHQAGALSEEDYARERRRVEEALRSRLRG